MIRMPIYYYYITDNIGTLFFVYTYSNTFAIYRKSEKSLSKIYTKICCWKVLYYVTNLQIIIHNEVHYVQCTTQNAVIPLCNLTGITLYWHQNDDQSVCG
jgi:hypothetical protein